MSSERQAAHGFSADAFSRPRQPANFALENAWIPPAPANGQRGDIPPPDRSVAEIPDLHYIDVAYQDIADNHPQQPANPAYVFPDVGDAQGIRVQAPPNTPVNQERNLFGYVPPHVAQGFDQAAFPPPFFHRIHTPDPPHRAGAENLRRLASHYLHHPDAQVRMITMEATATGRIKVAVIFETPNF